MCTVPVTQACKTTAKATVYQFTLYSTSNLKFKSWQPVKIINLLLCQTKEKKKADYCIGNFEKNVVRSITFILVRNKNHCNRCCNKKIRFKGSETSLRLILEEIGFKIIESNQKILVKCIHFSEKRIHYLQHIKRYREEGR